MIKYSIIIPAHNEEESLPVLLEEISGIKSRLENELEIIVVNDGSTDNTQQVLQNEKKDCPELKVIRFDKNYGQSAAFDAGFKHAGGEIIITMDADLQNNPEDIFALLKYYPEYDIICGKRIKRKDDIVRKISSKIANSIRNKLTGDDVVDTGCSLKIFKAEFIKNIKMFNGMHRFLPTLCKFEGARVIEVEVSHRFRKYGKAHYGILNRAIKGLQDAFAVRWMKKNFLKYKIGEIMQ